METIRWYEDSEIESLNEEYYEIPFYLERLCKNERISFNNLGRRPKTKLIKNLLALLANKHGYRVYTNQLDELYTNIIADELKLDRIKNFTQIRNREWLFDIHWYLELGDDRKLLRPSRDKPKDNQYRPTEFPLAVECEWEDKEDEVKSDFQKLLFCNADKRLIIYKSEEIDKEEIKRSDLSKYFVNAINSYPKNCPDTKFIFAAFYEESKKIILGTYYK